MPIHVLKDLRFGVVVAGRTVLFMVPRIFCRLSVFVLLLLGLLGHQARAQPCCGPITANGQKLSALLDQSGVDHLWQPHIHINWQTGVPDPARPEWSLHITHCSAYAASMAARVGIYLLRPPAHGQGELANAQFRWLQGAGARAGWKEVDALTAQSLANRGYFVVAVYENRTPHRPGHIAIIRPSEKTAALLNAHGPDEAQAGFHNRVHTTIQQGFAEHKGAWEPDDKGAIRFFAHAVVWANQPHSSSSG